MGAGLGHAARLLQIAKELARHGHEPIFALQNLNETAPIFRDLDYPVLQAPVWWPKHFDYTARSYADVLTYHGYSDQELLLRIVKAWDLIIDHISPDLVITDAAPSLNIAARNRVPVVLVGSGFCVPPSGCREFPTFQSAAQPLLPHSRLLDSVNHVQRSRRCEPFATLPEIMRGNARFITTFPEIDPYEKQRPDETAGPLKAYGAVPKVPDKPYFFAYLPSEHPSLDLLIYSISKSGLRGMVYVRNATKELVSSFANTPVKVVTVPQDMDQVMKKASVVLHHAGAGLSADALAGGRPQVVCPMYLEQGLTAQQLQEHGVAIIPSPERAGEALRAIMTDRTFSESAQSLARQLSQRHAKGLLDDIVKTCERLAEPNH